MHPGVAFEPAVRAITSSRACANAHDGIEVRPQHFFQALAVGTL